MTDRELLEFAAKAAGLRINFHPTASYQWNPLERDDEALRLAVKLGMSLHSFPDHHQGAQCVVTMTRHAVAARAYADDCNGDLTAATRRAIVRAAAAIGKEMP